MSENSGESEQRNSNEIEEVEEDTTSVLNLTPELDQMVKNDPMLKKLSQELKKKRTAATLGEQMDEEILIIYDENTHTTFHLPTYVGSSFNGMINFYTGYMTPADGNEDQDDQNDPARFIIAKEVGLQEQSQSLNDLQERVRVNGCVSDHPNIVGVMCSLTFEGKFYVCFQNTSSYNGGSMVSLRHLLRTHFPNGMPVNFIVVCLREALKGLFEIHRRGQVHKEISAGQIYLGQQNDIKLGFSATIDDRDMFEEASSSSSSSYLPISKICEWASAPEVYGSDNSSSCESKADVWLIGIAAIELVCGAFEATDRNQLERILDEIHMNRKLPIKPYKKNKKMINTRVKSLLLPPCLNSEYQREKKVWKDFEAMVMKCLQRDVNSRPTVEELLSFKVFVEEENDAAVVFDYLKAIEASKD